MKTRVFPECNYKAIYLGGNTLRLALNPSEPIKEVTYPEFYDVKVTSKCGGGCGYCYQNSVDSVLNQEGIVERF